MKPTAKSRVSKEQSRLHESLRRHTGHMKNQQHRHNAPSSSFFAFQNVSFFHLILILLSTRRLCAVILTASSPIKLLAILRRSPESTLNCILGTPRIPSLRDVRHWGR
jgi:hypothetical protein